MMDKRNDKLKIILNDNKENVVEIKKALKDNDGYCPCKILKNKDTKCICLEFRQQSTEGLCHCGLYKKIKIK